MTEEQQARIDVICEQVAEGQTLRQIAAGFGVSAATILKWVTLDDSASKQYARARELAADLFENEIYDAAMSVGQETAAADRVKIDALKWIAARRAPKRYGDRVEQHHTGGIGTTDASLTDQQKAALDRALDQDV